MLPITTPRFANREDAGCRLAARLAPYASLPNTVVLALPKGGVSVGTQIAKSLGLPFDIFLIAPITTPACGSEPLGALTGGGVRMLNFALIDRLHLSDSDVRNAIFHEAQRLTRREKLYRASRPSLDVADHTVILADDGTSSCDILRNGIRLLRRQHADRIVVATPVACHHAACEIRLEADEFITLEEPEEAVPPSTWFHYFPHPSVTEVRHLIRDHHS